MEIVMLIIVVAAVAWWLGFVRSARKLASMAEAEVGVLEVMHKASQVRRVSEIKVTDAQLAKATANVASLSSFDLFAVGQPAATVPNQN